MLASSQPMFIVWGPSRTLLYNDGYAEILARQTPRRFGTGLPESGTRSATAWCPSSTGAYAASRCRWTTSSSGWSAAAIARKRTFRSSIRRCAADVGRGRRLLLRLQRDDRADHGGAPAGRQRGAPSRRAREHGRGVHALRPRLHHPGGQRRDDAACWLPADELVGRNHWERFPGTCDGVLGKMYRSLLMADGEPRALEHLYRFTDGRERLVRGARLSRGGRPGGCLPGRHRAQKLQDEAAASWSESSWRWMQARSSAPGSGTFQQDRVRRR